MYKYSTESTHKNTKITNKETQRARKIEIPNACATWKGQHKIQDKHNSIITQIMRKQTESQNQRF